MSLVLRPGTAEDAAPCGSICYEAFRVIGTAHNFPPDFPSAELARGFMAMKLAHPSVYSVVAELDGHVVGSSFLDERACISGVGPVSVDPNVQNRGVGARLMQAVIERAGSQQAAGVRLLQAGFHNRSLCLYSKLGFRTREPMSIMQGKPLGLSFQGYAVRPATAADVAACARLCLEVHGFAREAEVRDAIERQSAAVVEHLGRITAYSTGLAFSGHSVAETNQGLQALIGAATEFLGAGFLVPTRNHELFTWCLNAGLKLVYQMTLMSIGLYNEPCGAYLPSVTF